MEQRLRKIALSILTGLLLVLSLIGFSACGGVKNFKLSFIVDDAVYATVETTGNEAISIPEDPTKTGYTFEGWYWDKDVWENPFTANSLLDAPISSNMNLYAYFKEIHQHRYEHYVYNNDATSSQDGTETAVCENGCGETDTRTATGTKLTNTVSFKTLTVNSDGTVYGKVANGTSTFSFLQEITTTGSAEYGVYLDIYCSQEVKSKTVPLVVGDNIFYVWTENAAEGDRLYAVTIRVRPMYTVSFDGAGGSTPEDQQVEEDSLATLPTTARTGYTFDGWDFDFNTPVTDDVTITASWKANTYTVSFDSQGGSAVEQKQVTYDATYGEFTTPTRTGYTFLGWYTASTGGSKVRSTTIVKITDDQTLYAKWTINTYNISYNLNGGSVSGNPTSYDVEDTFTLNNPAKTGYTFTGWTGADLSEPTMAVTVSGETEDRTYTASWEIIPYTITYNLNGGSVSGNPTSYDIEDTFTLDNPTRTGYTFLGWTGTDLSEPTMSVTMSNAMENRTYTANWEIIPYNISYNLNGGSVSGNPTSYDVEDTFTLNNPAKTGYTFTGWTGADLSEPTMSVTVSNATEKRTYTANWAANTYTVSFDSQGGSAVEQKQAAYDSTYGTLPAPEREGYTFNGWYTAATGGTKVENTTVVKITDDQTLYAQWTIISYTITYNLNGGSVSDNPTSYDVEDTFTLNNPTKTGYTFLGWTGADLSESTMTVTVSGETEDRTYTASWKANTYTVSFDSQGGSAVEQKQVTYDNAYGALEELTRTGYTFGWYTASTGGTKVWSTTIVKITDDQTLYAQWITDAEYTLSDDGLSYVVTGLNISSVKDLVILETYNEKPVVSIADGAFDGCSSLTSVTIGDSVTSIGYEAFYNCSSLTSIVIPDSVTSVGSYAFWNCNSLTSITIPDSVTSIVSSAFYECSSLTKVNYTGTIDDWAMIDFTNAYANPLYYAKKLYINDVEVSEVILTNATKIEDYAFYNCSSLTSIVIPDSVTSIGSYAFDGCRGLTSVTIGDGVTSIGYSAFYNCSRLARVTIGNGVTSIGSSAFKYCSGLTSVTIGDSVTSIGERAFYDCDSLTSVTIGDGVISIDPWAFSGCNKLIEVYNLSDLTITAGSSDNGYVGYYAKNVYTDTEGESKLSTTADGYIVYADDTAQEYYLMGYTGTATQLTLPKSINGNDYEIYQYAFEDCSSLTSIIIPDSVTSIGYQAFYNCSSLTSIIIPNSVTSIGYQAFYNCSSLTSIVIPDSVTAIDESAFYGCSSLEEMTLPFVGETKDGTSNTHFGYIFGATSYSYNYEYVPTSLKKVTITGGTSIGSYAFRDCISLTSVTIGDGVTSIGSYAFSGCDKLIEVYNLSDLTITAGSSDNGYVGYYAKNVYTDTEGESKLSTTADGYIVYADDTAQEYYLMSYTGTATQLTLPESINGNDYEIYMSAFSGCSSLTSIVIPDGVASIGKFAFFGCSSLTSVAFKDTSTLWYGVAANGYDTIEFSITSPSSNATHLKSTYFDYCWYKKSAA